MIIGSILKLTAALNYNQDHLKEQASRIKTEFEKRKMIQQIEKVLLQNIIGILYLVKNGIVIDLVNIQIIF